MPDFAPRARDGFVVSARVLTWDLYVFAVTPSGGGAAVFLSRRGADVERFLIDLDAGRLDGSLRAALARPPRRQLRRPWRTPSWHQPGVGIEHEYRVLDGDGRQVDVRPILHHLGIDGVRADPSDPNAYRCSWGGVITADGREVEVATPPIAVVPGFVARVVASAEAGRATVEALLPVGLRLEGYSTHLNVSAPGWGDDRRARRYARTFAPALMLAMDQAESPGLLVRPRPGRLELGGEFVDGEALGAAVALAAGGVLALRRLRGGTRRLTVRVELEPGEERYGWFVARTAFGSDLYESGRAAVLVRPRGSSLAAGDHLAQAWSVARRGLEGRASETDLAAADEVATGERPLPSETGRAAASAASPGQIGTASKT